MWYYEKKLFNLGVDAVIGVDEAGRGPLAGPVVAAAVSLPERRFRYRIDDSKKLTCRQRREAFNELICFAPFAVGICHEDVIDRVNILQATRLAMKQAVESLAVKLQDAGKARMHVLIDGPVPIDVQLPLTTVVGGDAKSANIAGASIIAKVVRDCMMDYYDAQMPQYGFKRHKGYPTAGHRQALKQFGASAIHRKSFSCVE